MDNFDRVMTALVALGALMFVAVVFVAVVSVGRVEYGRVVEVSEPYPVYAVRVSAGLRFDLLARLPDGNTVGFTAMYADRPNWTIGDCVAVNFNRLGGTHSYSRCEGER